MNPVILVTRKLPDAAHRKCHEGNMGRHGVPGA
jgi:hypothetical protein